MNPQPKMSFVDFNQRVEDKCIRTWDINWNGGTTLFIQRFENKSDLTRDTDIQKRVTEEYKFETSLADLIGNSLQAVLSNERRHGKHTRVGVVDSMISIFDSVPRMAGSCEEQAMGAQPSNLKTGGSISVPEEEEISRTSLGSFTQIDPSTCDLIAENWEDLTDVMPLKIAYPALDRQELRTITRLDPKNTEWADHNGSSWPMPLMEKMRFRWGTTNVAIMTNEGIILGVDSRSVVEWKKDKFIWSEDEEKLKVISAKSNIVFTAMGDATEWQQLFDYVKAMVEIREYMTKDVVTISKAYEIAKNYLYEYVTSHPKNELCFGGILAGCDKKTGFEAYEVSLYKLLPIHGQMEKYGCMTLGSGGAYAKAVLENYAQDRSQMSTETAANVVLEALLFAGYCDENTGGKMRVSHLREKDLLPKYNVQSLDAQLQHPTNYGAQQMLFVLFDKSTVTGGLSLGEELRKQWPCGSLFAAHRSVEKNKYFVHALYFDGQEEATNAFQFVRNAHHPPPQPQLPLFKSMQLTLNGSMTSLYVSRCTKEVLTFLCSLV